MITNLTILNRAWTETLAMMTRQREINEEYLKTRGRENSISVNRLKKLKQEERELHAMILEAEQAEA